MEVWKDIEGFEGLYQVSNLGRVKSLPRLVPFKQGLYRMTCERMMKIALTKAGYCKVCLCKPNVQRQFFVHRLVAQAFIPNPLGLPIVNHKDENPLNCSSDNLEWCSYKYNSNYGTCRERIGKYAREHPRHRNHKTGRFEAVTNRTEFT